MGPGDAKSITQTFKNVFPQFSVWNSFLTRIVLLVGSREKVILDKNLFEKRLENPELKKVAEEMKVMSFLDFADFFLTDGDHLSGFLENAEEISDDKPLLEFSKVSLLPPMKWETDESFLNILRHRIYQKPHVKGLSSTEQNDFDRDLQLRTAQRLGVFSQRYHGPGAELFAAKNYLEGLKAMNIYFENYKKPLVHLDDARWQR